MLLWEECEVDVCNGAEKAESNGVCKSQIGQKKIRGKIKSRLSTSCQKSFGRPEGILPKEEMLGPTFNFLSSPHRSCYGHRLERSWTRINL